MALRRSHVGRPDHRAPGRHPGPTETTYRELQNGAGESTAGIGYAKANNAPGENDVISGGRPGAGDLPSACRLVGTRVGPSMCAPPIVSQELKPTGRSDVFFIFPRYVLIKISAQCDRAFRQLFQF